MNKNRWNQKLEYLPQMTSIIAICKRQVFCTHLKTHQLIRNAFHVSKVFSALNSQITDKFFAFSSMSSQLGANQSSHFAPLFSCRRTSSESFSYWYFPLKSRPFSAGLPSGLCPFRSCIPCHKVTHEYLSRICSAISSTGHQAYIPLTIAQIYPSRLTPFSRR